MVTSTFLVVCASARLAATAASAAVVMIFFMLLCYYLDFWKLCPLHTRLCRLEHGFNKSHPDDTVFNRRKIISLFTLASRHFIRDGLGRRQIDICKRLDERLLMAERRAAVGLRDGRKIAVAAPIDEARLVHRLDDEFVWMFLMPLQRRLGAIDADVQV